MPLSRRQFLFGSAAAGAGLFLSTFIDGRRIVRAVPIAGGTLDPLAVPKFATPLLIPPVMPRAGTKKMKGGKNGDLYEISMRQFEQQILPAGLPTTTVWGYGAVKREDKRGLLLHNAP
jgi:spore coat protein A